MFRHESLTDQGVRERLPLRRAADLSLNGTQREILAYRWRISLAECTLSERYAPRSDENGSHHAAPPYTAPPNDVRLRLVSAHTHKAFLPERVREEGLEEMELIVTDLRRSTDVSVRHPTSPIRASRQQPTGTSTRRHSTVLDGTSMPLPNLTSRAAATRLGRP